MNNDATPTTDESASARVVAEEHELAGAGSPDDRHRSPEAHGFDPISAVLGVLACLAGALVVTGTVDPLGADDAGVWIAAAVIVIGVVLLPWGGRRTS